MPNPADLLTSADAAARLGVGVTAIKRWADQGRLPCVRTAGGHRRFRRRDVERLGHAAAGDEWAPWMEALVERADVHAALALLFAERARRGAWHAVAEYVGELLEVIGERWVAGTMTVAQEHVASAGLQRAIALAVETLPVGAGARRALVAPAEGDEHTLGLALAELCLREAGWRAESTGSRTRTVDVVERVRTGELAMVALSASALMTGRRALRAQVRAVGAACQRQGVALVLGGSGVWPEPPPFGVRLRRWEEFYRASIR
jgi:excisionase family DNA binding protein